MTLFRNLFHRQSYPKLFVSDDDIVAMQDGNIVDIHQVSDPAFACEQMGKSIAFQYTEDVITLCAPANGILKLLFPTGHAYGIQTKEGMEILVHCGINTVEANGKGFQILEKKQGDHVNAGDPIVKVDVKALSKKYDMSTILILTKENGKELEFIEPQSVSRGQSILKRPKIL